MNYYDGTGGNTVHKRHIVENGPILVYRPHKGDVSDAYNEAVWADLAEWEVKTNMHLPEGRKIKLFEEVDFDPLPQNVAASKDWSIEPGSANCAGGWKVSYDHPNSGQFPPNSIIPWPSAEDPQYPVYGNLMLAKSFDKDVTNSDPNYSALAKKVLKALTSHEAGRGFGYFKNSMYDNHVMSTMNAARDPPIQVTDFEELVNAVNFKLRNLTDMKFYSKAG